MTKIKILQEIVARIKIRLEDAKACGRDGRYAAAHKLKGQAEELENLISVITDDE